MEYVKQITDYVSETIQTFDYKVVLNSTNEYVSKATECFSKAPETFNQLAASANENYKQFATKTNANYQAFMADKSKI